MSKCTNGEHLFIKGTTACCNCGASWVRHLKEELSTKTRELEVANSFLNKAMRVIRNLDIDGVFLGAFDVCGDKENEQVEVDDLIEEFLAYKEQKDER